MTSGQVMPLLKGQSYDIVPKRNKANINKELLLLILSWSMSMGFTLLCMFYYTLIKKIMGKIQTDAKIKLEHTTRKKPDTWPLLFQVRVSVMFVVVGNEPSNEENDIFLFSQCVPLPVLIFLLLECLALAWNDRSASLTILFCDYHFNCLEMLIFGAHVSFKCQMLSRMLTVLQRVGSRSKCSGTLLLHPTV